MVLTVTLNPLLEKRFSFHSIKSGGVNRAQKIEFKAGGKGINVSRQLNFLGISNMALTFAGGQSGKIFRSILHSENIDFKTIPTKAETREASLVFGESEKRLTSFFPPNPEISQSEVDEFLDQLRKMIRNCSIVVFSGSSPCEAANHIFTEGIKTANELDKIAILDTYGKHLDDSLLAIPFAVHNNRAEVESSLGIELSSEEKLREYLVSLYEKGIKLTFLSDGKNPMYASKFDFHYKVHPHEIDEADPTGSGDAFTAGICLGLEKSLVFDEFTKIASALGALNAASWKTCSVSTEEVAKYQSKVEICEIGKKMKLIDDSPND